MKHTGKSAFELRTELLQLAFEILLNQHRAKAEEKFRLEGTKHLITDTFPTTEEVIAEAEKLNNFISRN